MKEKEMVTLYADVELIDEPDGSAAYTNSFEALDTYHKIKVLDDLICCLEEMFDTLHGDWCFEVSKAIEENKKRRQKVILK